MMDGGVIGWGAPSKGDLATGAQTCASLGCRPGESGRRKLVASRAGEQAFWTPGKSRDQHLSWADKSTILLVIGIRPLAPQRRHVWARSLSSPCSGAFMLSRFPTSSSVLPRHATETGTPTCSPLIRPRSWRSSGCRSAPSNLSRTASPARTPRRAPTGYP